MISLILNPQTYEAARRALHHILANHRPTHSSDAADAQLARDTDAVLIELIAAGSQAGEVARLVAWLNEQPSAFAHAAPGRAGWYVVLDEEEARYWGATLPEAIKVAQPATETAKPAPAVVEDRADVARLQRAYDAAVKYIDECPCDPDIHESQARAWSAYLAAKRALENAPEASNG